MSYVTNVILYIGILNDVDAKIKEVNAYFEDDSFNGLVSVEDEKLPNGWYGGSKYLECDLFIGAFNYLNLRNFINHLKSIEWDLDSPVQLIVLDEDDIRFKIYDIV